MNGLRCVYLIWISIAENLLKISGCEIGHDEIKIWQAVEKSWVHE